MATFPYVPSTTTQVEIDFGAVPLYSQTFTITDPLLQSGQLVDVTQSGDAATGRQADENEMDRLAFAVSSPTAGQFVVYVAGVQGPVAGKYKILYILTQSSQL